MDKEKKKELKDHEQRRLFAETARLEGEKADLTAKYQREIAAIDEKIEIEKLRLEAMEKLK